MNAAERNRASARCEQHPEPFPYVVPAALEVASRDVNAHLMGTHPRPLPGVDHRRSAEASAPVLDAALDEILRTGDERYRIDTRNILVFYKGGLVYLHSLPRREAVAVFLAWYDREQAADRARADEGNHE